MKIIANNGRCFEIHGTSKDDYYSVLGATLNEVLLHQTKLDSFIPSRGQFGKFGKLRDAKKFIKIVAGEI